MNTFKSAIYSFKKFLLLKKQEASDKFGCTESKKVKKILNKKSSFFITRVKTKKYVFLTLVFI